MAAPDRRGVVLLVVLLGLFAALVAHLFVLRFSHGDVYPLYSSLRADPLGTKALADSLAALREATLVRNFDPLTRLEPQAGQTLVLAGTDPQAMLDLPEAEAQALDNLAAAGGRLVIALGPGQEHSLFDDDSDTAAVLLPPRRRPAKPPAQPPAKGKTSPAPPELAVKESLGAHWGVTVMPLASPVPTPVTRAAGAPADLPEKLAWHNALALKLNKPGWRPLYLCRDQVVMAERSWGRGTLVLATDSYLLSNEALRQDRQTRLLAWLIGANPRIVFDETHLGVGYDPGVASLAWRYGLQGAAAGLLLLAALYLWRSVPSFLPPLPGGPTREEVELGHDQTAGFVNLLQRQLPAEELAAQCLAIWKQGQPEQSLSRDVQDELRILSHEPTMTPVERYRAMVGVLRRRRKS